MIVVKRLLMRKLDDGAKGTISPKQFTCRYCFSMKLLCVCSGSFFLPDLVVKQSGIANAGYGLFLLEDVYPGQIITMYSKIIISEKRAKILKEQVFPHSHALFNPLQKLKQLLVSFYNF